MAAKVAVRAKNVLDYRLLAGQPKAVAVTRWWWRVDGDERGGGSAAKRTGRGRTT